MSVRIRHLALYTENQQGMAAFYKTVFGMKRITESFNQPNHGHISDGVIGLAVLRRRPGFHAALDHFGFEVGWVKMEEGEETAQFYHDHAERACESFNSKFWYSDGGYLYDIVDGENGNDNALRPNQVFSISLCHPVLEQSRWKDVLTVVKDKLLTPVGLRSLAPGHPDYKSKYFGDLRARDAAYHQGTVWGWLAGPFIDAWLKVYPEDIDGARGFLDGFQNHLNEACIGSISEIFDAEKPYTPRGCIAQAWSVAEVLRCLVKTAR
jgi:glycogen debranching enzyme